MLEIASSAIAALVLAAERVFDRGEVNSSSVDLGDDGASSAGSRLMISTISPIPLIPPMDGGHASKPG